MPINLRALLEEMIEKDASDLHLVAGERPKLRVDGDIVSASSEDVMTPKDTLSLAYSVLTENQKKPFETESELDFSFGIQNLARFRGNVFKQRGCVSVVIRQIPFNVKTFNELGLPNVVARSEEHTSELQSQSNLVCRLLLEKKKNTCDSTAIKHHQEINTEYTTEAPEDPRVRNDPLAHYPVSIAYRPRIAQS